MCKSPENFNFCDEEKLTENIKKILIRVQMILHNFNVSILFIQHETIFRIKKFINNGGYVPDDYYWRFELNRIETNEDGRLDGLTRNEITFLLLSFILV